MRRRAQGKASEVDQSVRGESGAKRRRAVNEKSASKQAVTIPVEPIKWRSPIYRGRETEYAPLLPKGAEWRGRLLEAGISKVIGRLFALAPSCLHASRDRLSWLIAELTSELERPYGLHRRTQCPLSIHVAGMGRVYCEMGRLLEVAGPTCVSGEAVAWAFELGIRLLRKVCLEMEGENVLTRFVSTPSDYASFYTEGASPSHSTGCHFNISYSRDGELTNGELELLTQLLCPLGLVFGPGGLDLRPRHRRFCCDPRALHVERAVGGSAHDEGKPLILLRDETHGASQRGRIQITGFGGPRSPLSTWLQAELIPLSLQAVLDKAKPPVVARCPREVLRAQANETIKARRPNTVVPMRLTKKELALVTCEWLLDEVAKKHVSTQSDADRLTLLNELVHAAIEASSGDIKVPVVPTDVAMKRVIFNVLAQNDGFDSLESVFEACSKRGRSKKAKEVLERMIVADVLFTCACDSTYDWLMEAGLAWPIKFEREPDISCLGRGSQALVPGISERDKCRADLLVRTPGPVIACWDAIVMSDGRQINLPNPWSRAR